MQEKYEDKDKYNSDGDEINSDGDDDYDDGTTSNKDLMDSWKWKMEDLLEEEKYLAEECEWHWTPSIDSVDWDDSQLISADYYSTVWSPYAIPHGIGLHHYYHSRPKWNYIDFNTHWEYDLLDFEEEASKYVTYKRFCSNMLDKIDNIKTPGLNKETYKKLRCFLYGTHSKESESVTCSAYNFWRLLFASMGTTDSNLSDTLGTRGCVGYHWEMNDTLRKKLYDDKAIEPGDDADPNGPFEKYNPCFRKASWLRHKILEITDNLGPVMKHYVGPTMKDANGSDSNRSGSDYSGDEGDY
eukprot:scaffold51466_cov63-Cyclotella_meneghiniana.AAC.1